MAMLMNQPYDCGNASTAVCGYTSSEWNTVTVDFTFSNITFAEAEDSAFQSALISTLSSISGATANQISVWANAPTLSVNRRTTSTSMTASIQSDTATGAQSISDSISTASGDGSLLTALQTAAAASGSSVPSAAATSTSISGPLSIRSRKSDGEKAGIAIGAFVGILVFAALFGFLSSFLRK